MRVDILTLFPEMFQGPVNESLIKKAREKGLLNLNIINIRDFTTDKHKTADDTPYGGGPGMVMKVEPIAKALSRVKSRGTSTSSAESSRVVLMCPAGKVLTQEKIKELAEIEHLIILCGHYEGVDERVKDFVDEEISIGDYVLTGGELPAMVLVDAVARHIPGIVKEEESVKKDSFYPHTKKFGVGVYEGLLDYPSYTKPEDYEGKKVPEVLLSGHHAEIDRWRRKEALRRTFYRRPDLLAKADINDEDRILLKEIIAE